MLHGFGEYLIGRGSVYLGAGGWIVFWYVVGEIGSGRMEDAAEGGGMGGGRIGKRSKRWDYRVVVLDAGQAWTGLCIGRSLIDNRFWLSSTGSSTLQCVPRGNLM